MPEVLEMDSDVGRIWRPTLSEGDWANWAIACMLGDLVEVQEGIQKEMEFLWYLSEQVEDWLEELVNHLKL